MTETPSPAPSLQLLRAQGWYPPAMIVVGLLLAASILPLDLPQGWGLVPSLLCVAVLGLCFWWMSTRRAIPKNGYRDALWAWAGFLVLRLLGNIAADVWAWGTVERALGTLVCATPFFALAWISARRLRRASELARRAAA